MVGVSHTFPQTPDSRPSAATIATSGTGRCELSKMYWAIAPAKPGGHVRPGLRVALALGRCGMYWAAGAAITGSPPLGYWLACCAVCVLLVCWFVSSCFLVFWCLLLWLFF